MTAAAAAAADLRLVFATDSVPAAMACLERKAIDRFSLREPRSTRWFGERAARALRASPARAR